MRTLVEYELQGDEMWSVNVEAVRVNNSATAWRLSRLHINKTKERKSRTPSVRCIKDAVLVHILRLSYAHASHFSLLSKIVDFRHAKISR